MEIHGRNDHDERYACMHSHTHIYIYMHALTSIELRFPVLIMIPLISLFVSLCVCVSVPHGDGRGARAEGPGQEGPERHRGHGAAVRGTPSPCYAPACLQVYLSCHLVCTYIYMYTKYMRVIYVCCIAYICIACAVCTAADHDDGDGLCSISLRRRRSSVGAAPSA